MKILKKKNYLMDIIKKHPNIASGRKNYKFLDDRIMKQYSLIKKFKNNFNKS